MSLTGDEIVHAPPAEFAALAPDAWTQPFWDAAARHQLVCATCASCGLFRMPPAPFCSNCRSQDTKWTDLPGTGSVYTYTIVARAVVPQLVDFVPYVIAVVTLDGTNGRRLVANIVNARVADLRVGLNLRVVWDDVSESVTIPRFEPALLP